MSTSARSGRRVRNAASASGAVAVRRDVVAVAAQRVRVVGADARARLRRWRCDGIKASSGAKNATRPTIPQRNSRPRRVPAPAIGLPQLLAASPLFAPAARRSSRLNCAPSGRCRRRPPSRVSNADRRLENAEGDGSWHRRSRWRIDGSGLMRREWRGLGRLLLESLVAGTVRERRARRSRCSSSRRRPARRPAVADRHGTLLLRTPTAARSPRRSSSPTCTWTSPA